MPKPRFDGGFRAQRFQRDAYPHWLATATERAAQRAQEAA